jgi:hypothetical protein
MAQVRVTSTIAVGAAVEEEATITIINYHILWLLIHILGQRVGFAKAEEAGETDIRVERIAS